MSQELAEAFVLIRAKGDRFGDDVRDIADKAGKDAGDRAGKTFADRFSESAQSRFRGGQASFVSPQTANQSGKTFADQFVRGADGKLRDSRGRLVSALGGEDIGRTFSDQFVRGADERLQGAQNHFADQVGGTRSGAWSGAGYRAGTDFSQGIGRGLSFGLKGLGGIALGATALTALGATVSGTVSVVADLAGALLALPAAGAAVVATYATIKIGTAGFFKALDAAASGNTDAVYDALKKLTPEARSAFSAVNSLTPRLADLRSQVESNLFSGLGPAIGDLGSKYIPVAATGFGKIAAAVNNSVLALARFANESSTVSTVARIFDQTAISAGNFEQVLPNLAAALLDVVDVGIDFLPAGAQSLEDASGSFRETIADLKESGRLKEIIQSGVTSAKDLVEVLVIVKRGIKGLFDSAGDVSVRPLDLLKDNLEKIVDELNRPDFKNAFGLVLKGVETAANAVGDAIPYVTDALVRLGPALGSIAADSGVAFADIMEKVSGAIETMAPLLDSLAGLFHALAPIAGDVVLVLLAVKGAMLGVAAASKATAAVSGFSAALRGVSGAGGAGAAGGAAAGLSPLAARLGFVGAAAAVAFIGYQKLSEYVHRNDIQPDDVIQLFDAGEFTQAQQQLEAFNGQLDEAKKKYYEDRKESPFFSALKAPVQGLLNRDTPHATDGINLYVKALTSVAEQVGAAGTGLRGFNADLIDADAAAKIADNSLDRLTLATSGYADAILAAKGNSLSFERALLDANRTIAANGETANKAGTALDTSTYKGIENAEALYAIADAGLAIARDTPEGADAQEYFADKIAGTTEQFIRAAREAGLTKDAAKKLAESILGVPSAKTIDVAAKGIEDTREKAVRLTGALDRVPESKSTAFAAEGLKGVTSKAGGYSTLLDGIRSEVGTSFVVRGIASAISKVKDFASSLFNVQRTVNVGIGTIEKRALGGPVLAGQTYLVGEEGPELFTPETTGAILSAGATKKAARGMDDLTQLAAYRTSEPSRSGGESDGQQQMLALLQQIAEQGGRRRESVQVVLDTGQLVGAINRAGGQTL